MRDFLVFGLCLLVFAAVLPADQASGENSRFPSLLSSIRIEEPLDFCGERVPLEKPEVRERMEKDLLLTLWDRAQTVLYLKRGQRYLPHIEKMLREAGLPEDL